MSTSRRRTDFTTRPLTHERTVHSWRPAASRGGADDLLVQLRGSHLLLLRLGGRRVAVLGEMLELGSAGPSAHESVLSQALGKLDQVVTVGDAWPQLGQDSQIEQLEDEALYRFIDSIEQAAWGKPITLLIKGANKVFWASGFVDRLKLALIERQTGT